MSQRKPTAGVSRLRKELRELRAEVMDLRAFAEGTALGLGQLWDALDVLHGPEIVADALTTASLQDDKAN